MDVCPFLKASEKGHSAMTGRIGDVCKKRAGGRAGGGLSKDKRMSRSGNVRVGTTEEGAVFQVRPRKQPLRHRVLRKRVFGRTANDHYKTWGWEFPWWFRGRETDKWA